jgi:RNA polymerase sigma-70 factor (ECF subfamily)
MIFQPKLLFPRLNSACRGDAFGKVIYKFKARENVTNVMETATGLSDEQIVELALAGDAEAFGEIVRRWERRIYFLAYGILGREEDARDAAQETFIAAFRNLKNFRGEAKVSSWLHRIAVNQCLTRQRRARIRGEAALDDEQAMEATQSSLSSFTHPSPARAAESDERSEIVRRAVGALPEDLREVLLLKEYEEMTFQEISDTLGVPLSTVKSRLYTALKQLRARLEKYGVGVLYDEQRTLG